MRNLIRPSFSITQSAMSYRLHMMDGQMKKQRTFYTSLLRFHCGRHKQICWHPQTVRKILQTTQGLCHSCGKRYDYESMAPEHHWGGSIATDECTGVTSPAEGLCHVPPSSNRLAGSADLQGLWLKPGANACGPAPTLSGESLVQHDNPCHTKDQVMG